MAQTGKDKGMLEKFEEFTQMVSSLEGSFAPEELFSESFLRKYTQFDNLEAFKAACGGSIETVDDLAKLSDSVVKEKTKFSTAEEFLNKAVEEYVAAVFSDDE